MLTCECLGEESDDLVNDPMSLDCKLKHCHEAVIVVQSERKSFPRSGSYLSAEEHYLREGDWIVIPG